MNRRTFKPVCPMTEPVRTFVRIAKQKRDHQTRPELGHVVVTTKQCTHTSIDFQNMQRYTHTRQLDWIWLGLN